jgi:hypothetical protein
VSAHLYNHRGDLERLVDALTRHGVRGRRLATMRA